MKTNINKIIAVTAVAVLIAGNAFAWEGHGFSGQGNGHDKAKDAITRELNLSADQQSRLEQERTTSREAMEKLHSALKDKKRELQDAIAKPETTRQQVEPILAQIKKLQGDMTDKRADGIFAVKSILTPEQFAKLEAMKEKRMQGEHKKHGDKK